MTAISGPSQARAQAAQPRTGPPLPPGPPDPGQSATGERPQTAAGLSPAVSLPKGGGAIRGMGEKFSVNPVTGTGSLIVPLPLSPGRSGFARS